VAGRSKVCFDQFVCGLGAERWGAFEMTIGWTVAREKQFSALQDLLAECDRDGAGAAVVTGVTGVGKSALIGRLVEYAAEAGALVLTSAGSRDSRDRTLGVLDQLLAEHAHRGRAADAELPSMEQSATELSLTMELAFSTLIELASDRTVLLVIDDAHLSDTVSLFCVAYFLSTMSLLPIMIVLAGSAELATADGGVIPLSQRCIHVALEPFTELEVQELADAAIGRRSGAAFARVCHAASGGNPRLVDALLADSRHRRFPGGIELGAEFAAAMRNHLDGSPRALREVATAAAVMGDESTPLLISDVTRIDVSRVMRALGALNESGILVDTRFRHAGVRELILSWTHNWDQIRLRRRAVDYIWKNGGGKSAVEPHIVAINRLSEESLRPVLERCDVDAVDTADVELALRCLDCATCASGGEPLEQADGWHPQSVQSAMLDAVRRTHAWVQQRAPGEPPEQTGLTGQFTVPEPLPRAAEPPEPPGPPVRPPQSTLPVPHPLESPGGAEGNGGSEVNGGSEMNDGARSDRAADAGPDAAIAKLSGAECRVAALAARGHTNKAISTRLSITVSTVEQHLTRVYRKLNIQERQDLRLVMESDKPWIPLQRRTLEAERKNRGY
jgi:DNA-binding CsgD family transcriptional regulator